MSNLQPDSQKVHVTSSLVISHSAFTYHAFVNKSSDRTYSHTPVAINTGGILQVRVHKGCDLGIGSLDKRNQSRCVPLPPYRWQYIYHIRYICWDLLKYKDLRHRWEVTFLPLINFSSYAIFVSIFCQGTVAQFLTSHAI